MRDECCYGSPGYPEIEEMLTGLESQYYEYYLSKSRVKEETESEVEGNGMIPVR